MILTIISFLFGGKTIENILLSRESPSCSKAVVLDYSGFFNNLHRHCPFGNAVCSSMDSSAYGDDFLFCISYHTY